MATEVIREMVATLGFEIDDKAVDDLKQSLVNLTRVAGLLTGAVAGSAGAIWAWTNSASEAGDAAAKNARQAGLTAEAYQELVYAAEQAGAAFDDVRQGVIRLTRASAEAASGNESLASTLGDLGFNANEFASMAPDQQFEALAEALSSIEDPGKRTAASMALLGRRGPALASMFEGGAAGIREMREEAVALGLVISEEATQAAEDFSTQMGRLKAIVTGIKNTIGSQLIPVVNEYVDTLLEWFQSNKEIIQQNIGGMLRGMVSFVNAGIRSVTILTSWINRLADAFGGWRSILQAVRIILIGIVGYQTLSGLASMVKIIQSMAIAWRTVGTAALWANIKAMAIPIAIGAAIAAVTMLVQDFVTFIRGGDSLLGRFVERFAETEGVLGGIARLFLDWRDILLDLPGAWAELIDGFKFLWRQFASEFTATWRSVTDGFKRTWQSASNAVGDMAREAGRQILAPFTMTFNAAKAVFDWFVDQLFGGFARIDDMTGGLASSVIDLLGGAFRGLWNIARPVFANIARVVGGIADTILSVASIGGSALGFDTAGLDGMRDRIANMQSALAGSGSIEAGLATARESGRHGGDLSVDAGGVNVTIQGSTSMGPREIQAATARGTANGLQVAIDQADRTLGGGQR